MINKFIGGLITLTLIAWVFLEVTGKSTGNTPVTIQKVVNTYDQTSFEDVAKQNLRAHRGVLLKAGSHTLTAHQQYWIEIPRGSNLCWKKEPHMNVTFHDPMDRQDYVHETPIPGVEDKPFKLPQDSRRDWMGIKSDSKGLIILSFEPMK